MENQIQNDGSSPVNDGSSSPSYTLKEIAEKLSLDKANYSDSCTGPVEDRYQEDMTVVLNIFFHSSNPPTEEDYNALMAAMNDLVDLVVNGDGSGNYPTKEMVYNTLEMIQFMGSAGIKIDDPNGAAAVANWKTMGSVDVTSYRGNPISFNSFVESAASTKGTNTGEQISNAADEIYGTFMSSLEALTDKTNDASELLQKLTQLLDYANLIGPSDKGSFVFPPTNSGDIGPGAAEIYQEFFDTYVDDKGKQKEFPKHKSTEVDANGNIYPGPWYDSSQKYTWSSAFAAAYQYDVDQANQYVETHPGTTFDEAMKMQSQSADVINEFFDDYASESDVTRFTTLLQDEFFKVTVDILNEKGVDLEGAAQNVVSIYDEINGYLEKYDPDGTQSEKSGTLAYYLTKVNEDIEKFFGKPPVATVDNFSAWVLDLATPNSTTAFDLQQAINNAEFLNGQSKQQLQVMMTQFQTFMKMMMTVMEGYQQMVKSVASNVGR